VRRGRGERGWEGKGGGRGRGEGREEGDGQNNPKPAATGLRRTGGGFVGIAAVGIAAYTLDPQQQIRHSNSSREEARFPVKHPSN